MKLLKYKRLTVILTSLGLIFAFGVITSIAQETEISRNVPLPSKITVVPPSTDLPKEIAAFSGRWEVEPGSFPRILIVEEIRSKEAKVIFAWGLGSYTRAGYERVKAKVTGKGIQFSAGASFAGICEYKFMMDENLKTIHGDGQCPAEGGRTNSFSLTMKKIE